MVRNADGRRAAMTMYKHLFAVLLFALVASPALAADQIKIGFFDMQAVVGRSELGKAGAEKFKQEGEKIRERQAAKVKEIQDLEEEFKKKENAWSQDVKKEKSQNIASKKMEYEKATYEDRRQLAQLEQELLRSLQEKVGDIVRRIGKKGGYSMIFERRQAGLVYALPTMEITDQIVRELNQGEAKEQKKPETKKQ
jgi:outer membrane protein